MKVLVASFMLFCLSFCILSESSALDSNWHFTAKDVTALHANPADVRLSYGSDPLEFADLRLPKQAGLHPVAIIIHGGCWLSSLADLQSTTALSDALKDLGFATWNIEYRREDNAGGGWPGTFMDIANAADYLRQISKTYSLDLSKVIVIGHSAGGHLALWLAGRHKLAPSSPLYKKNPLAIKAVISMGGVPDLSNSRKYAAKICGSDVIGKLLGSNAEAIESHYKDSSPIALLPLNIKQVLIYGDEDQVVPAKAGEGYVSKAKALGDDAILERVKYSAHHEYVVPNSVVWPVILDLVHKYLN